MNSLIGQILILIVSSHNPIGDKATLIQDDAFLEMGYDDGTRCWALTGAKIKVIETFEPGEGPTLYYVSYADSGRKDFCDRRVVPCASPEKVVAKDPDLLLCNNGEILVMERSAFIKLWNADQCLQQKLKDFHRRRDLEDRLRNKQLKDSRVE